jgi:hypothetical protein
MFFGLFKKETDPSELTPEVRALLGGVSAGLSDEDAAEQAGVTPTHLRQLMRSDVFTHHLRRARAEPAYTGPLLEIIGAESDADATARWWRQAEGRE